MLRHREGRNIYGEGVLIEIKSYIPVEHISKFSATLMENVSVTIDKLNLLLFIVRWWSTLGYIILGDLNLHYTSWKCQQNNTAGNSLNSRELNSHHLNIMFINPEHLRHFVKLQPQYNRPL